MTQQPNVTEMNDTHNDSEPNDFDHIAERQGWNDGSRLDLMREFIAQHGLNEQLGDYAAEVARQETNEPTPRIFLDLSSSVLTEAEMNTITEAPPRVIVHEYGAWVHVPPAEHDEDPLDPEGEGWEDFPILNAVLRAARERGAWWVNIDGDGYDVIPGLPTHRW